MKNFYDSWQVILDDRGKPLVGKILFCEANTTDIVLKTVYTVDGQELDNPIYCNVVPSTQVMLGDDDYTVRFYRYIGHGNMESDENEDSWLLYKTELIKYSVVSGSSSGTIGLVDDVLHLKNWKGMKDGDVMEVLGYYTTEDCPARYFVWHANGNYRDDGGVIITSNTTTKGAWVMKIPGTYIDVRWYGDIPSRSASGVTSNMSQRTNAANAANKYNKDLYFPAYTSGTDNGFYLFDGSNTVSVAKDIICDDGVRFVVKEGTVGTSVICHELQKCEKYLFISSSASTPIGKYSIIANWINTSWFDGNKEIAEGARVGYIIDYIPKPDDEHNVLDFKNTKIKFERDGLNLNNVGFINCEFVDCHENINRPTIFKNMEIKQEWFDKDFDFVGKCAFNNCKIYLENFYDADTYIAMKNRQYEHDYGDLNEAVLHNPTIYGGSSTDPAILENFTGEITLSTVGSDFEMHNASVKINGMSSKTAFNLVDCWLTIPIVSTCKNIALRRGSIVGNNLTVLDNLYLEDVDSNVKIFADSTSNTILRNCIVNANITGRNLSVYDSHIMNNANIIQYDLAGVLTPTIIGNTFEIGSYYEPIALTAGTVVANGRINNNVGTDKTKHWIKLNRTNYNYYEYLHDYLYVGNVEPYMSATNDVSHYMKKYDSKTGKAAVGTSAPWIESPGKGYNAGGDPQWFSLYNYEFIKLRCFSFGLTPQVVLSMDYNQSLIYVSDSYRHPYYKFVLNSGLRALDSSTATDCTYEFVLGGGSSYDGYKYVNLGCDIFGHTGDDDYSRGYFYATLKFNIDRKQSTGLNDRRKDWTA